MQYGLERRCYFLGLYKPNLKARLNCLIPHHPLRKKMQIYKSGRRHMIKNEFPIKFWDIYMCHKLKILTFIFSLFWNQVLPRFLNVVPPGRAFFAKNFNSPFWLPPSLLLENSTNSFLSLPLGYYALCLNYPSLSTDTRGNKYNKKLN